MPGSELKYHGLLCVAHLVTTQFDSPEVHLNGIQRVTSQNHSHGPSHPHESAHDFHNSLQETPVLGTGTFSYYIFLVYDFSTTIWEFFLPLQYCVTNI